MVLRLGWRHGLISPRPAHNVILGYQPHRQNKTGVTRTMFGLTWFAPPISRTYALRYGDGGYVPDLDHVAKALEKLGSSRFPTRIIGFPSYLWFGLKRMEELGLRAQLPKGSRHPPGRRLETALRPAGGKACPLWPGRSDTGHPRGEYQ